MTSENSVEEMRGGIICARGINIMAEKPSEAADLASRSLQTLDSQLKNWHGADLGPLLWATVVGLGLFMGPLAVKPRPDPDT